MAKTIAKLSKLYHPVSFLQINTIKGFKYIDLAGEIVNQYHRGKIPPVFQMGLKGLIIQNPIEKAEAMKVTSDSFWMKFPEPDSLDMCADMFFKETKKVLEILEVEESNRIGWRNYYIHNFTDLQAQKSFFEKLSPVSEAAALTIRMEFKKGDLVCNLLIEPIVKEGPESTPAVLFDVDVYKRGSFKVTDAHATLREIREYLSAEDGFLAALNSTFK